MLLTKSMHMIRLFNNRSYRIDLGYRSALYRILFVYINQCSYSSQNYFKRCKISALALLKLVMHARSGGTLEVMGMLLGKIDGENMIVMDSFALPVEGTGKSFRIDFFLCQR